MLPLLLRVRYVCHRLIYILMPLAHAHVRHDVHLNLPRAIYILGAFVSYYVVFQWGVPRPRSIPGASWRPPGLMTPSSPPRSAPTGVPPPCPSPVLLWRPTESSPCVALAPRPSLSWSWRSAVVPFVGVDDYVTSSPGIINASSPPTCPSLTVASSTWTLGFRCAGRTPRAMLAKTSVSSKSAPMGQAGPP